MNPGKRNPRWLISVHSVVQQRDTLAGRVFDGVVLVLILISIATFSIDTLPDLEPATRRWLDLSEAIITILFTLEYILRTATTRPPWRYICSFYGIVDLLAIVPFYLTAGVDLRSLRIVRIFRVFRILKIFRYGSAINRFGKALRLTQQELALFMLATAMLLYISAVGIYYLEHEAQPEVFGSIISALWWAVATLTTVGYGDAYPVTVGGKFFTGIVVVLGMGVVAVPAGLIATALTKVRMDEDARATRDAPTDT